MNFSEELLNDHQVAAHLGISVSTVRRWRIIGQGPIFLKIVASVRYKLSDVQGWIDACASGNGSIPSSIEHRGYLKAAAAIAEYGATSADPREAQAAATILARDVPRGLEAGGKPSYDRTAGGAA